MNDQSTTMTVAKLEKQAREIGVPVGFFNNVLGMSNSTISYWKTKRDGRIPEQYQTDLINAVIGLKYILDNKRLVPAEGESREELEDISMLLESAKVLLRKKADDPMVKSAMQLLNSAIEIINQNKPTKIRHLPE